jgi:hypothetical protein
MMTRTYILAALLAAGLSGSAFAQKSDAGTTSGVGGQSGYGGQPAGTATTDAGEPGVADANKPHNTMVHATHRRPTSASKAAASNGAVNGMPGGDTVGGTTGAANGGGK